MNKRAHIWISGGVTGVGFRAWIARLAQTLGISGWVRNVNSITVEAVFEGANKNVEEIVRLCHRGPEVSWVEKIEVKWEDPAGEEGFEIRY